MSQILVHKLGALAHISPLLKSPNPSLQKNALSLLNNMSRTSCLQTSMGKEGTLNIKYLVCKSKSCRSTEITLLLVCCLSKAGTA